MLSILKRLPLSFSGELHNTVLLNFSVDHADVLAGIPSQLVPIRYHGRALVSMVSVELRHMRPDGAPRFCRFAYRHVGLRVLVQPREHYKDRSPGVFFLRSFSSAPLLIHSGNIFTDFRFSRADIVQRRGEFRLHSAMGELSFRMGFADTVENPDTGLLKLIGSLDRAYSVRNGRVFVLRIERRHWPLQPVYADMPTNSLFSSARFECACRVPGVIHYRWLAPQELPLCA